ncbi:diguanylate cyclase [Porticoccus sp.]
MLSFHWDSHFETGLAAVDQQHHHLVDIINQFSSLLTENNINIQDVDHLYDQLTNYAVFHFQDEEKMMTGFHLDSHHLDRHINSHKRFLDDLASIYATITDRDLSKANSFLEFLIHWLAFHILGSDKDMARQIGAIQSGISPKEAYDKLEQERDSSTTPLVEALNGLFEQVSSRNRELRELNESLEEKVASRTKELSEANQRLQEISLTDVLTGLPNRRHAMQCLSRLWDEALQNNSPLVCIMIDADYFKQVNDVYGHDAGDLVLKALGNTLQHAFRNDDIVCRLGGDEFFVICPKTDNEGGMQIAESVRKTVSALRIPTGNKFWEGSISIGVASQQSAMAGYEDLIKMSDRGVYAAKQCGRNCVRSLTTEIEKTVTAK